MFGVWWQRTCSLLKKIWAENVVFGAVQWLFHGEAVDVFGLERPGIGGDYGAHEFEC